MEYVLAKFYEGSHNWQGPLPFNSIRLGESIDNLYRSWGVGGWEDHAENPESPYPNILFGWYDSDVRKLKVLSL